MTEDFFQNTPYMQGGLLVDARNVRSVYAKDSAIFLECNYSEEVKVCQYQHDYEAEEDAAVYAGLLRNPLAAVFLIDANGLLKAYPMDSDEYRKLSIFG